MMNCKMKCNVYLDEANEFEATHTSNDIDIYHFNVDLGEEPNGLWNEAVNQFDVVHYYDEQDQELSAVEKFEYSILGYSPSKNLQCQILTIWCSRMLYQCWITVLRT